MSGEIFQPMENLDEPSLTATRNPLLCYLCNEPYDEPCILGCFHSFCARCLRGRATDSKMSCPLCGYIHTLKEGSHLPPADLLLKFMVESSTEEKAQCANCDSCDVQMFFCNTCTQPLCSSCREETHRAKMFSSHDMVLLTKRAREVHKKCPLHEEPYIMFSAEKKIMLCINCFRDMRIESRGHCLDLETAYKQSCKKLDLRVGSFRELQNSVREGILLFKALLEEIKTNADKERNAVAELHTSLVERLEETKALLLNKVDSQYSEKEDTFRSQLKSLCALLPTLHVHLVISSAFSGSANKFEFLDLAYVLMERLKSIVQKQHPLHPTQSGQIDTAYKTEFFKCLEPLLYIPMQRSTLTTAANGGSAGNPGSPCPGSPVTHRLTPNHARRANGLNGAKVKFIDAKGQFAEHCREFENAHRDLMQRFEQMKSQCQELQRDLTMRRCLAKKDEVLKLGTSIENVQNQLDSHYNVLEQKMPLLEKHWEESLERINNEQDLYQAQLQDVMRLKQESQHLRVIASQLTSFVSSIAAVTERLAPKLGQSNQTTEQEQQMLSLMEEINAVQPDSQQRVDAIRGAEEERQISLANRTNPLDDELIKTKGLLRAPSLRDKKGERRRRMDKDSEKSESSTSLKRSSSSSSSSSCHTEKDEGEKKPLAPSQGHAGSENSEPARLSMSSSDSPSKLDTSSEILALNYSNCDEIDLENTKRDSTKNCAPGDVDEYVNLALSKDQTKNTKERETSKAASKDISPQPSQAVVTLRDKNLVNGGENKVKSSGEEKKPRVRERKDERLSVEIDVEARRNLLKDVENFKKKESFSSPKKLASNGDVS